MEIGLATVDETFFLAATALKITKYTCFGIQFVAASKMRLPRVLEVPGLIPG